MAKVKMYGNKIAVEKAGGAKASDDTGFFKIPESAHNYGTVRFLDPALVSPDLHEGSQVYFGNTYEPLRIQGVDVLVMDAKNIVATVTHESQSQ